MSDGRASKPRSKKLLSVLAVLMVLVAGSGGYLALRKPGKPVAVPGAVLPLPETTINLPGGHLLQVGVDVQLQEGVSTKSLPADVMPRMENAEIVVLSGFSYSRLLTTAGKASARADLMARFQAIGGPGRVGPAVMNVYFTDFVMQ